MPGCDEKLAGALHAAQDRIEEQHVWLGSDVAKTRRLLIDPILLALGWDVSDAGRVTRSRYEQSSKRRDHGEDYALYVCDTKRVIVKAASLGDVARAEVYVDGACGDKQLGVATDGQTWTIWRGGSESSLRIDCGDACRRLSVISRGSISEEARREDEDGVRILIERFNSREPDCGHKGEAENANRAARLLMGAVVDCRRAYADDADAFLKMELAYLNTLLWAKSKRALRKRLEDIGGLDSKTRERIIGLSVPGRFRGISRMCRLRDGKYRKGFLDLVEMFLDPAEEYGSLMGRLEEFAGGANANMAGLTGLFSSLRPNIFMPYNRRSVSPLNGTSYERLDDMSASSYRRFNDLYRSISEGSEDSLDLVDLDIIAYQMSME